MNNAVVIKGTTYGFSVYIDEQADFAMICDEVRNKFRESAKFFGNAKMAISFDGKKLFENISIDVRKKERVFIMGANGCGKSTLISILAGVQRADDGSFICDGADLFHAKEKRRELGGYVPQGTPLLYELTALDNLKLWYDKKALSDSLENGMLKKLGIDEFLKIPVCKMSGGMK